jgi:mannose/fructose-specific phosphotransferase system component IIA
VGDVIRLYIIAGCAAALVAGVLWLRHDAVQSERARQEAERAKVTIEALKQNKEDREDAQNLDDDGLLNALGRWLLPSP